MPYIQIRVQAYSPPIDRMPPRDSDKNPSLIVSPPPSGVAPLIFMWARSLSSSHLTSRSSLGQTTYPLTLPCHCSIHHQHRIYFNCQKMHFTEASGLFLDNFLLDLHTRTHQTTDQSDDEDSEGALEGDAVEAGDYVVHETDDFWNGEDVDMDPREGIVSGWDLLGKDFIVEAEELRKFGHSLLHTL